MANVLLVKGFSQYDAMNNYLDEIEKGFRLAGYNTYVIDGEEDDYVVLQMYELAKKHRIDILFSCDAMAYASREIFFPDACFITYLCDHPAALRERLAKLDDKSIVFTCDNRHVSYIKRYCPNIKYVEFVPLSGSYLPKYIPYKERTKDIVFTGSYKKPEENYGALLVQTESVQVFAKYMADNFIKHSEQDLEDGLNTTLSHFGIDVPDQEFHELADEFCVTEWYARNYFRDKMIRSLLNAGLKVHVYGNGWEDYEGEGKENLIIEKGNYYIARKAVADAKISLNIMPWFKEGFQERIATAMLSGTVAVTDESGYILDNFSDGEELVIYSLKELGELPKKVDWLLQHPEEAELIAQKGRLLASQALTWQHRTLEMVTYIQQCFPILSSENNQYGEKLLITHEKLHERQVALETIKEMNEIINKIVQVQMLDNMEVCDVHFFYDMFLERFSKAKSNYPELVISEYIYDYITSLTDEQVTLGTELLIRECEELLTVFLTMEKDQLMKDNEELKTQLAHMSVNPNKHSQEVLIKKMKANYQTSKDAYIQEILNNIEKEQYVGAYNQNFVYQHMGSLDEERKLIDFDEEADMYYALWNGKRMYYPKGYTIENVASSVGFVELEQDMNSPHRYLDESFDVQEGDIVIDAGVAEGNFALDIIDRAKKVYLVECEHKWVEALQKTFEPWADKVVIIEKMLGDKNDDKYASIDGFVEEGYVNFIKMDVEGAEIASLNGATSVLKNSSSIKCAICSYHRKNAEKDIRQILEEHHFYTSTTKGYMFFKEDMESWVDGELRHGIVRAIK